MSLTSIEGLVIGLLFVVPGSLGIGFRDYLWPRNPLSTFDQVVLSLAYSTGALFILELSIGAIGLAHKLIGDWVRF